MTSFYMGRRTFLKTGVAAVAATALRVSPSRRREP